VKENSYAPAIGVKIKLLKVEISGAMHCVVAVISERGNTQKNRG
jgi:hypothetical protein